MRSRIFGLAVAAAVIVGSAPKADAQFSVTTGNPYTGQSFSINGGAVPYGYGVTTYSSNFATPSGYATAPYPTAYVAPPVTAYVPSAYVAPTSYVAPAVTTTYLPRAYYSPVVTNTRVRAYAPYPAGYTVGYRPGLLRRVGRGVYGGPVYTPVY